MRDRIAQMKSGTSTKTPRAQARGVFTCQHCGSGFEGYVKHPRKYCSPACFQAARPTFQGVEKVCRGCGEAYRVMRRRHERSKYCSAECRDRFSPKPGRPRKRVGEQRTAQRNPRVPVGTVKVHSSGYATERVNHETWERYFSGTTYSLQVPQHRLVMSMLLNRPLLTTENVHHLNGVRSDNRPENLELWTTPQPPRQRASDLVQSRDEQGN